MQGCTKLVGDESKHATQETLLVGTMITMARIMHSGDLLLRWSSIHTYQGTLVTLERVCLSELGKAMPWRKSKYITNKFLAQDALWVTDDDNDVKKKSEKSSFLCWKILSRNAPRPGNWRWQRCKEKTLFCGERLLSIVRIPVPFFEYLDKQ